MAGGGPLKAWGTPPRQGRPSSPRQVLERQARVAQRVEAVGAAGTEEATLLLARNEVRAHARVVHAWCAAVRNARIVHVHKHMRCACTCAAQAHALRT